MPPSVPSRRAGGWQIHRHIYITMDQSIRIYQQSGSICESQGIQGATLILSQGTNSEHPSIKDCEKKGRLESLILQALPSWT